MHESIELAKEAFLIIFAYCAEIFVCYLSQLIQLTRGNLKIPYTEHSGQMMNIGQNAIFQNLSESTCCDREDWIDHGRNAMNLYDQSDSKLLMPFVYMEGRPTDHDTQVVWTVVNQLTDEVS